MTHDELGQDHVETIPPEAPEPDFESWQRLYSLARGLDRGVVASLLTLLGRFDGLNHWEQLAVLRVAIRSALAMRKGRGTNGPWDPHTDDRNLMAEVDSEIVDAPLWRELMRIREEVRK